MDPSFQAALAEVLATEFAGEYRDDLSTITGHLSDLEIAALVDDCARTNLRCAPERALFAEKSVGFVVGLELEDGDQVVLKLFHPDLQLPHLEAIHRCLAYLTRSGFPTTPQRGELFATPHAQLGAFYSLISGDLHTGHEPPVRLQLATLLARMASVLRELDCVGLPDAPGHQEQLWQASNRSFLSTAATSEFRWIDDIGASAQRTLKAASLPLQPAHMDWGVKNSRFHAGDVVVVYDWDSLCCASEAEMVGRAAAQFTAQWQLPAGLVPSSTEALAFVREYEAAARRPFDPDEWQVLRASAEYLTAQVARLEAAHPQPPTDGFLARLRRLGDDPILPATSG